MKRKRKCIKRDRLNRSKLQRILRSLELYGYRSEVGAINLADIIADEYEKEF